MKRRQSHPTNMDTDDKSQKTDDQPKLHSESSRRRHKDAFKDAWNALDSDLEKQTLKKHNKLSKLADQVEAKIKSIEVSADLQKKRKEQEAVNKQKGLVPADYKGPHFPTTAIAPEAAIQLVEFYKRDFSNFLPEVYARNIISGISAHYQKTNKYSNTVSIPSGGKLTVIGDIHGQLPDIRTIFELQGYPDEKTIFLFNGDLVDRGPHGPAVLLSVFALVLAFPQYVFVNRGNHESGRLNEKYAFADQMRDTYSPDLFEQIRDIYNWMPFFSIVEKKVFVVHGGIPQYKDFHIDEFKEFKLGHPTPRHAECVTRLDFALEGFLWSDPDPDVKNDAGYVESKRGAGIKFGANLVENFMKKNGFELIIRSHELKDEGYEYCFEQKLMTLFSASAYAKVNDNKAAIAVFRSGAGLKPEIVQFYGSLEATDEVHEGRQKETLHLIKELIAERKHKLLIAFDAQTREEGNPESKKISVKGWAICMRKVLDLDCDWILLSEYLCKIKGGNIDFIRFLSKIGVAPTSDQFQKWTDSIVSSICAKIHSKGNDLLKEFKEIDKDGSGQIGYSEFCEALSKYDLNLTESQLFDFMQSMDTDSNGCIDSNEFVSRFNVTWTKLEKSEDGWLPAAIQELSCFLYCTHDHNIKTAFRDLDSDKSGRLGYKEFSTIMKHKVGAKYSKAQRKQLFHYVDKNGDGSISWKEFKHAFRVSDKEVEKWQNKIMESLCSFVYTNKDHIKKAFHAIDQQKCEVVSVPEFICVLQSTVDLLPSKKKPLTSKQIEQLAYLLKDDKGLINWKQFVDGFVLQDSQ